MKNAEAIYSSIVNGKLALESLDSESVSALFGYLCECIENGKPVDRVLLDKCADLLNTPEEAAPDNIISNTYKRLQAGTQRTRIYRKNIIHKLFIAALAVLTFVVSTFITASALGVDIVESVKIILTESKSNYVIYEDNTKLYVSGNPEIKRYDTISELFEAELAEYIYPTQFPNGVQPYSVKRMYDGADDIFQIQMRTDGENWVMLASDAENSYLPSGYTHTVDIGGTTLDFVYTVSRKGAEITKYSVYTVYAGVQYTFHLHTGDWETVKAFIESVNLPQV